MAYREDELMVSVSPELEEKLQRKMMMARLPKAATRHDLDRMIVGNQIMIMAALAGLVDRQPMLTLDDRIQATRDWWRSHYREDVVVMPAPKEE